MRRAAQANWSRPPNHNPPRFYTAWVKRYKSLSATHQAKSGVIRKPT
jgi:hypothetical protein